MTEHKESCQTTFRPVDTCDCAERITMNQGDFYFHQFKAHPSEYKIGEPDNFFIFVSKTIWDTGGGLDNIDEPEYLYDSLSAIFGDDSDATMENVWEFWNHTAAEAKDKVIAAGYVENSDLADEADNYDATPL